MGQRSRKKTLDRIPVAWVSTIVIKKMIRLLSDHFLFRTDVNKG